MVNGFIVLTFVILTTMVTLVGLITYQWNQRLFMIERKKKETINVCVTH